MPRSSRRAALHVSVAIRTEADSVRVTVRDRGPGIAPEFQPRIFQKFRAGRQLGLARQGRHGPGLVDRQDDHGAARRQHRLRERAGRRRDVLRHAARAAGDHDPRACSATRSLRPAVLVCEDDPDVARAVETCCEAGACAPAVPSVRQAKLALDQACASTSRSSICICRTPTAWSSSPSCARTRRRVRCR